MQPSHRPNVTLTWNAVEGGTYSVDASANNSTWTSKATGLTVSATNTKSNTHATLGSTGTEYARVNRTALATYDTLGVVTPTVSQTTSTSFNLAAANVAPTLTTINPLANGTEDTVYSITYAAVAAAANEADANGDAISFKVIEVYSGTLTKNGVAVVEGTLLSSGDSFVWTPPSNANGVYYPMSLKAFDGLLESGDHVGVPVPLSAVNDAPTVTHVDEINGATEDTAFTITYATLAAVSDDADVEGSALSFSVASLGAGTLTKNGNAVTVGTSLASGESFVWTPPADAYGNYSPFSFTAYDGELNSSPAVNCHVIVAAVNDAPTVVTHTIGGGIFSNTSSTYTYAVIANNVNEADVDGDAVLFRVESVSNGTLTKNGTAVIPGTTTITSGESLVWTPNSGVLDTVTAYTLKAFDGSLASTGIITVEINVTSITRIFTGWASTFNLAGADALEDADPDKDGVANAIEYVLGRNPSVSDVSTNPLISTVSGGTMTLSFYRYDDSEGEMNLDVQYSTDLSTWSTVGIEPVSTTSGGVIVTVTENGSGMDWITVQMPVGTNTRMFSRLRSEVD
jgi:Cadherin-like domain